ncbi:Uncharacterised protein [uncultured archaeon]|nr:Uncharacterised protein [uncultured archaeon]
MISHFRRDASFFAIVDLPVPGTPVKMRFMKTVFNSGVK